MLSLVPGVYTDIIPANAESGYILSDTLAIPTRLIGRVMLWKSVVPTPCGGISLELQGAYNDTDAEYVRLDTTLTANETRTVPSNYRFFRVKQYSRSGGTTTTVSILCDEGAVGGVRETGGTLSTLADTASKAKTVDEKLLLVQVGMFELLRLLIIEQRITNDLLIEGLSSKTVDIDATRRDFAYISDIPDLSSLLIS